MPRILVVANEPLPRASHPSSGPGLRALELATGLAEHGHKVTVAAASSGFPTGGTVDPAFAHPEIRELDIQINNLPALIHSQSPDAVILTNYVQFRFLLGNSETRPNVRAKIIYDFYAPKFLERYAASEFEGAAEEAEAERARKIAAIRASDAFLLNGEKKIGYLSAWMMMADRALDVPVVPTPFSVPVPSSVLAERDARPAVGPGVPLRLIMTGNQQAWTKTGLQLVELLPRLQEFGWHLTSIGRPDLSQLYATAPKALEWLDTGVLASQTSTDFNSLLHSLAECDVHIDLFDLSKERELAYVTRTAVAMSVGIPVIHPEGTETAEFVRRHNIGWLYRTRGEIFAILDWIRNNPDDLQLRTQNARGFARNWMNPSHALVDASRLLEKLTTRTRPSRPALAAYGGDGQDGSLHDWMSRLAQRNWFGRKYEIDPIALAAAPSGRHLYVSHGDADRKAPNFLFEFLMRRHRIASLKDLPREEWLRRALVYVDAEFCRRRYDWRGNDLEILQIYLTRSEEEGLSPNVYFDERTYLRLNPEVEGVLSSGMVANGYHHYLVQGMHEGRVASPMFDEDHYVSTNADLDAARHGENWISGFVHFMERGVREGRKASPVFDSGYYLDRYSDLPRQWIGSAQPANHFVRHGFVEGRIGSVFHQDLVAQQENPPPLVKLQGNGESALSSLPDSMSASAADLRYRLQRHLDQRSENFNRTLESKLAWLKRLDSFSLFGSI